MANNASNWTGPMSTADLEVMFSNCTDRQTLREIRAELDRRDDAAFEAVAVMAFKAGDRIAFVTMNGNDTEGEVWSLAPNASVWVMPDGGRDAWLVKLATPKRPTHREVPNDWRGIMRAVERIAADGAYLRSGTAHTKACAQRCGHSWPTDARQLILAILGVARTMDAPKLGECLTAARAEVAA